MPRTHVLSLLALAATGDIAIALIGAHLPTRSRSGANLVPIRVICQVIGLANLPLLGYGAFRIIITSGRDGGSHEGRTP
jgi:hypothetical protein